MNEEKKSFNKDGLNLEQQHEHESDEEEPSIQDYESEASTDSDGCEKCPICLLAFSNEIGRPKVCQHLFCFPCIDEWSKVMKTCPIDRREFSQIEVFDSLATDNLLRTITVNENISIKELTGDDEEEQEFTPCEICRRIDREDVMLLCDGCDKGFHMDCLDPPLDQIPNNNWYCSACENNESDSSSDESEEVEEETANEIILREQPQIVRTRQSERIRNAILARRSIRGALHEIQRASEPQPSTSRAILTPPSASMKNTRVSAPVKRTPVKRRKKRRRRAKRVVEVVEYEIKDGQKFPVIKRTRKVARRKKRKNKRAKKVKTTRRSQGKGSSCGSTSIATGFKSSNSNVYDLQRGRQLAGLSNFNIFEPSNLLDYVPDDECEEEYENQQRAASTLTQSIVNYINPLRRQALINKRVIENCTTTSSSVNLLDSILNEQDCFVTSGSGKKGNSSTKLNSTTANSVAKQASNDDQKEPNSSLNNDRENEKNENRSEEINFINETISSDTINFSNSNNNDEQHLQPTTNLPVSHVEKGIDIKKKRKKTFDMFEDSPMDQEEEEQSEASNCPNFSIYDLVNSKSDENLSKKQEMLNEENVDLVQMSDEGEQNSSEEIEPAVVRSSQPASPDLENEINEQVIEEDRSYTPPIVVQRETKDNEKDDKSRKDRDDKKYKRREMERYNVRERFKSPGRQRDRFGRNRTRSRSKSRSRRRVSRKRSRSLSINRDRSRHRRSRSKNIEKRRKRSYTRSTSRKRDSSNDKKHKKNKHKKSYRRTKSRSQSPKYYRDKSPRRRERSTSEKTKKKRHRNRSKEKSSTRTKEVYASGQNILVSVNFTTKEDKRSRSERSKSEDKGNEPVVDITTKKKINVSSKPVVAIIDLARSPFKELTPEYKKESNVIELSDSEGEKQNKPPPKSPDSTKLYDPFDIFNSPNENVSSSQNTMKSITRDITSDFTNKLGPSIIKNLPLIANSEENLVSSSSSVNMFDKLFTQPTNKIEVLQNEVIQHSNNASNNNMIESPYSPGNDDDYRDDEAPVDEPRVKNKTTTEKESSSNILDELFGSSSPPASVDKNKSTSIKKSSSSNDPSKYLTKLKRQERVIEEVKLVIKPYYSKRMINKEQYKEIMRKAVPKICHNKTGEINPVKIKYLIDSYVKMYTHKKKRNNSGRVSEEIF
ncbi:hypothetical protein PVAND_014187 [Polypedilum vanderplanki]|uniref:PHD and RING finger domain-containing protein 1 n=1 Tax=Polypedilum vanderplanki TaxID=319348 RepID=A0A9J6CSP6_POLVA|nr:hypothetical protein PVAND_014187 [Polypedilum vanderplanki]